MPNRNNLKGRGFSLVCNFRHLVHGCLTMLIWACDEAGASQRLESVKEKLVLFAKDGKQSGTIIGRDQEKVTSKVTPPSQSFTTFR